MNLNEKIFSLYENILSKKSLVLEQSSFVEPVSSIPGIDEMVWNKSPYNYDAGRMQRGLKWPGHDTHIHFGFTETEPNIALAIIKKSLSLGLTTIENPYLGSVGGHDSDSRHYGKFEGTYDGKVLGRGLDVSGDREKMIELYNWVVTEIGGGQPVPFVAPDSGTGTETSSPLDFLENLPDNSVETLKNIGIGGGVAAGVYGGYKLATANKGDKNTSSSSSTTKTDSSTDLGIHSKFVYGGRKESPFLSENLNEQTISGSFGKDVVRSGSSIMIPKGANSQANSPVSGKVDNNKRSSFFSCKNKTDIYFEDGKFFLRYCGLDNTISNGVSVNVGSRIGDVNQNVMVYLYDKNGSSKSLSNYAKSEPERAPETYQSRQKSSILSKTFEKGAINSKPARKEVAILSQKRGQPPTQSRSYSKVSLMKELAENIKKIKKLL